MCMAGKLGEGGIPGAGKGVLCHVTVRDVVVNVYEDILMVG